MMTVRYHRRRRVQKKKGKDFQSNKIVKAGPVSPHGQPPVTSKKDLHVNKQLAQGRVDPSDSGEDSSLTDNTKEQETDLQMKILNELQKVNTWLDLVEDKVAAGAIKKKTKKTELSTFSQTNKRDGKKEM